MSRLFLVLLFSTAVSGMYTEVARKLNERVVELFNADKFADLVKELFHEDAVFFSNVSPAPVTGHDNIAAYLKGASQKNGKLSNLKIVSASEGNAVAEVKQGDSYKLTVTEKYKDSKFTEVKIDFQKI